MNVLEGQRADVMGVVGKSRLGSQGEKPRVSVWGHVTNEPGQTHATQVQRSGQVALRGWGRGRREPGCEGRGGEPRAGVSSTLGCVKSQRDTSAYSGFQ